MKWQPSYSRVPINAISAELQILWRCHLSINKEHERIPVCFIREVASPVQRKSRHPHSLEVMLGRCFFGDLPSTLLASGPMQGSAHFINTQTIRRASNIQLPFFCF